MNSPTIVDGLEILAAKRVDLRPLHILLVGGQSDSLTVLRGSLVQAMLARGHRVTTAAGQPEPDVLQTLSSWGATYHEIPMERAGLNPFRDKDTIAALVRLMREVRPDVVVGYQAKPLNYAMIAAAIAGVRRRIGLITGLGYAFTEGNGLRRRVTSLVVRVLYGIALRLSHGVVFQNEDDRELFLAQRLVGGHTPTLRVNGSGVDLEAFRPVPLPDGPARFLMIGRMLKDKGIYEFVEAARLVKQQVPDATFTLVGPFDPNPAAIRPEEVKAWVDEGLLDHTGAMRDVRPAIAAANIVVLPSYREGVPKTLLEAMAMGRPIVTTDVPGCRDAVTDDENGLLVPPRDAVALALAMEVLANSPLMRQNFGEKGRMVAERLFDARVVNDQMIAFIQGK